MSTESELISMAASSGGKLFNNDNIAIVAVSVTCAISYGANWVQWKAGQRRELEYRLEKQARDDDHRLELADINNKRVKEGKESFETLAKAGDPIRDTAKILDKFAGTN